MADRRRIIIPLPRIPGVVLGMLLTLLIVGGFMAVDRTIGHWYSRDADAISERLDEHESQFRNLRSDVASLDRSVGRLELARPDQSPRIALPATTRWIYVSEEDAANAEEHYPGEGPPPCSDFSELIGRTAYPDSEPYSFAGITTAVVIECSQ